MSVFSKIISGEIPAHVIKEDDDFIAFLDISPLVIGHVLVVPKREINKLFDLPENLLSSILIFAKPIAAAIEKSFNCNRCGISVIGLEVPHAHVHLIPINSADDINFTRKKLAPTNDSLAEARKLILKNLN